MNAHFHNSLDAEEEESPLIARINADFYDSLDAERPRMTRIKMLIFVIIRVYSWSCFIVLWYRRGAGSAGH
jgi:hypothetical protein